MSIKVEEVDEYDGSYACVICSESVRGDDALCCSQCLSNPFHARCVVGTAFAETCPQCAGRTVVPWTGAKIPAATSSATVDLTGSESLLIGAAAMSAAPAAKRARLLSEKKSGEVLAEVEEDGDVSQYERDRNARIAANRQLLIDLGLASVVSDLAPLGQSTSADVGGAKLSSKKRKAAPPGAASPGKLRRSTRGLMDPEVAHLDEIKEEAEAEYDKPAPRPLAAAGRSMAERMKELELGSLVDLTAEAAVWIVMGSTKKPYKVSIGELKTKGKVESKCACRDFRIRKRDCKHITLLKTTLGLLADSSGWHVAASQHALSF
jgi:hypothetical protein